MSDAVLAMSFVFFVAMIFIPIWGPHVFFQKEREAREARQQQREKAQAEATDRHYQWITEWEERISDAERGMIELQAKRHNDVAAHLYSQYQKEKGGEQ